MKALVRRAVRKAAGLPPESAPLPHADALADLSRRLDAMDKGLQEMILATRAENDRGLARVRAEIDELMEVVDGLREE